MRRPADARRRDAGPVPDAAAVDPNDAEVPVERDDAAISEADGDTAGEDTENAKKSSGCQFAPRPASPPFLLLSLAFLGLVRRRRSR